VFRSALQPWLRDRLTAWTDSPPRPAAGSDVRAKAGLAARFAAPGVLANLITSAVFAIAHLYGHSPPWALATFFPSLVFGLFRDRYNSLSAPIALHVFYNAGYFSLVA
jgi:membrane protease YdiL (CAAX protease family)